MCESLFDMWPGHTAGSDRRDEERQVNFSRLLERNPLSLARRGAAKAACWAVRAAGGEWDVITSLRRNLADEIVAKYGNVVCEGPFAGLRLPETPLWGGPDTAAKILGIYEREVVDIVAQGAGDGRRVLVDLGAADGFYALGSVGLGLFEHCIAYEADANRRKALISSAAHAGIEDKLLVRGHAGESVFSDLIADGVDFAETVILCDIEGGEFEIFDPETLWMIREAQVVIEIHDWSASKTLTGGLKLMAENVFDVSVVRTGCRDLSSFRDLRRLPDNERWLLASEGRREMGVWLHFKPRL